jgi:adenine-specific DNA-methyltransferase
MMYPRLKLARNLLRDDGVIFVSIDDHEVHNLRHLLDEVFGPENLLTQFAWRTDGNFDNQAKFKRCHEYIVVYGRSADAFPIPPVVDPNVLPNSKIYRADIRNTIVKNGPKNPIGEIVLPAGFPSDIAEGTIVARRARWPRYHGDATFAGGRLLAPVTVSSGWSSKDLLLSFITNGCQPIEDSKGQSTRFVVSNTGAIEGIKQRTETPSHVSTSLQGLGGPQKAAAARTELGVVFDDYPKPVELLSYFVRMVGDKAGICMDFFAGSGTLGDAILRLGADDKGKRRFGIAALKDELNPEIMRVVFKDSGFADDVAKTNASQILRQAGIDDVKSL